MYVIRRILTPILWLICLATFMLPWTSIRCDGGKELGELQSMSGQGGGGGGTIEIARQNGFQVLTGGHSLTKDGELVIKGDKDKQASVSCGPAYILWGTLLGILVCIVGGIALPKGKMRRLLLPIAGGIAIGTLALQSAIGLPARDKEFLNKLVPKSESDQVEIKMKPPFTVQRVGFLAAWVLVGLAAVLACLELLGNSAMPPVKEPKRRRDEEEEPSDDEEGERPRSRSRR